MLYELFTEQKLHEAWDHVKRGGSDSAGMDGITVIEYSANLKENLTRLLDELISATYVHKSVKYFEVKKASGGSRTIGLLAVQDRIVHTLVKQYLDNHMENQWSDSNYGYRHGRSAHQAAECIEKYIKDGFTVAAETDIRDFFDSINHHVLEKQLRLYALDENIIDFVMQILKSCEFSPGHRIVQGSSLSPVLANCYLNALDRHMEKTNKHRYLAIEKILGTISFRRAIGTALLEFICM